VTVSASGGRWLVPASRAGAGRLDLAGAVLSVAALGVLTYAIIEAPGYGWLSATTLGLFAASVALLAVFVVWEARSDHPMLPLHLFRNPRFTGAGLTITVLFSALSGVVFLNSQILQLVLGYSPLAAGVRALPSAAALAVCSPLAAHRGGGTYGASLLHATASAFVTGVDRAVLAGAIATLAGLVMAFRVACPRSTPGVGTAAWPACRSGSRRSARRRAASGCHGRPPSRRGCGGSPRPARRWSGRGCGSSDSRGDRSERRHHPDGCRDRDHNIGPRRRFRHRDQYHGRSLGRRCHRARSPRRRLATSSSVAPSRGSPRRPRMAMTSARSPGAMWASAGPMGAPGWDRCGPVSSSSRARSRERAGSSPGFAVMTTIVPHRAERPVDNGRHK
jgi:hypothetical protein